MALAIRFWRQGILLASALMILASTPAQAGITQFLLHDHPNGQVNPPSYGFRFDDLFGGGGIYTFSFDYADINENADVRLDYDDVQNTIRIYGRAFGGKDTGTAWDPLESGWITIDFTYNVNVNANVDNSALALGDDYYVTNESPSNSGSFVLDGWGGDITVNISDKFSGADGHSFGFDNDYDSKGNATIANDPLIYSGDGWLAPPGGSARDWIFIGEMMTPLPVEQSTWGSLKRVNN